MNQVEHLRRKWRSLAREFEGRDIALYGAGRHTQMMLQATGVVKEQPHVTVILDDDPPLERLQDVPVRRPEEVDPAGFAGVVVSSDVAAAVLTDRAATWARRVPEDTRPKIIHLYERTLPSYEPASTGAGGFDLPVPGDGVRAGYAPQSDAGYLQGGFDENTQIRKALADNGRDPATLGRILDWGCSSGRVLRFWADLADTTEAWGCDIDESAIDWAVRHLCPPFRFFSTTVAPWIPVADRTFDLVYGISIFTHIDEHVDTWLMELRRITADDGLVLVTIHDEHTWARCAREPDLWLARNWPGDFDKPFDGDFIAAGRGPNSQTFWRTDAVRRRWSQIFDIVDIRIAEFTCGTQTGVLMRPRA